MSISGFLDCIAARGHAFEDGTCRRCGAKKGGVTFADLLREMHVKRSIHVFRHRSYVWFMRRS